MPKGKRFILLCPDNPTFRSDGCGRWYHGFQYTSGREQGGGGSAIDFNANEHAPKCSAMSLASARSDDLCVVQEAWQKGGRDDVEKAAKEKEAARGTGDTKWSAG